MAARFVGGARRRPPRTAYRDEDEPGHLSPESSGLGLHIAPPGAYTQLRRAFERQLMWADDFARAGDLDSALDARRAADAVRDEASAD